MAHDNLNLFDVAGRFDLDENGDRPEMFIHNGLTDEVRFRLGLGKDHHDDR